MSTTEALPAARIGRSDKIHAHFASWPGYTWCGKSGRPAPEEVFNPSDTRACRRCLACLRAQGVLSLAAAPPQGAEREVP